MPLCVRQGSRRLKAGDIIVFSRAPNGALMIGSRQPRPGEPKAPRLATPRKKPEKRPLQERRPSDGSAGGDGAASAGAAARKRLRPARPPNPNPSSSPDEGAAAAKRAQAASRRGGKAAGGRHRQDGRALGGSGSGGDVGAGARGEAQRGALGRPPRGQAAGSWAHRGVPEGPAADGVFRAHPDGLTDDLAHGKVLMQVLALPSPDYQHSAGLMPQTPHTTACGVHLQCVLLIAIWRSRLVVQAGHVCTACSAQLAMTPASADCPNVRVAPGVP